MLVDRDSALELDESELFEEESAVATSPTAPVVAAVAAEAAPLSEGESESDDDGIVLESECSSSGGQSPGCWLGGEGSSRLCGPGRVVSRLHHSRLRLLQTPRQMTWRTSSHAS